MTDSTLVKYPIPLGTIVAFFFDEKQVPPGWILCDGGLIHSEYQDFITMATTNITPDLRGRTIIGAGLSDWGKAYELDKYGGTHEVTLDIAQMPRHNHTLKFPDEMDDKQGYPKNGFTAVYATDRNKASGGSAVDSRGNDQPHNNMQPHYNCNYIMFIGYPKGQDVSD